MMEEDIRSGDSGVFGAYAGFYDALYADKDYEAECDFIVSTFGSLGMEAPARILDLGCGTGGHAIPLARRGFTVMGLDRSEEMVQQGRAKASEAGLPVALCVSDIRDFDLGETFDAAISMFAVVGYQLSNSDLASTFRAVRSHLEAGGLFMFDVWFGPAVLVDQPKLSSKTVTTPEGDEVIRSARPTLDIVGQTVTVDYELTRTSGGVVVETVREVHRMRFMFVQEMAYFLEVAGFELIAAGPFLALDRPLTTKDWNVSIVARAR